MEITLLANACLALSYNGQTLLIDLPEDRIEPFQPLQAGEWDRILTRQEPYDNVCGIFFTHGHPDHCDRNRVAEYRRRWPHIPVFLPEEFPERKTLVMGSFLISYERLDHAPMDPPPPEHVVAWIRAGSKSIYVAADGKLDVHVHSRFLKGRVADAAFWNAMYLSRPETRQLMEGAAAANYIYHMPGIEPDPYGIWKKCRLNQKRHGDELTSVCILDQYPTTIQR